jgi:hypothetical protein
MTAPNTQISSLTQQVASSIDGVSLVAAVDRRTMPTQTGIPVINSGQILVFSSNNGATSNAANGTATQTVLSLTTANSVKANVAANEMVLCITKPGAQAGMGIMGVSSNAADTIQVVLANPTAANVALTANQTYYTAVARGLNTITIPAGSGLAANLAANSTVEQTITLNGNGAAATCTVNAAGQVIAANVTAQGSMYMVPPTVVFNATPTAGLGNIGNAAGSVGGYGATALATISGGGVTSIIITNGGQGYTTAPSISLVGGTVVAPGMFAAINQTNANIANLGIGNVRVSGPNQISVQFVNPTTANVAANSNMTFNAIALPGITVASPICLCSGNMTTTTATGANAANITTMNVNNISANDVVIGYTPALANSNTALAGATVAANAIGMSYFGITNTPSVGLMVAAVHRNPGTPPVQVYSLYLAPTSVANNTTAEQIFTLPANITLFANSAVGINKPSYTPSISIVGCRANSTTTLGVTFMNTSAAAITPPAENYVLASFTTPTVLLDAAAGANVTTGCVSQFVSITQNQLVNLTNEVQQSMVSMGMINGG